MRSSCWNDIKQWLMRHHPSSRGASQSLSHPNGKPSSLVGSSMGVRGPSARGKEPAQEERGAASPAHGASPARRACRGHGRPLPLPPA